MNENKIELKPCPFCGGEAGYSTSYDGTIHVFCKECKASSGTFYAKVDSCAKDAATEAWNRRAEQ